MKSLLDQDQPPDVEYPCAPGAFFDVVSVTCAAGAELLVFPFLPALWISSIAFVSPLCRVGSFVAVNLVSDALARAAVAEDDQRNLHGLLT